MISFSEDIGAIKVAPESEVEQFTSSGYVLKAVVQETIPVAVYPSRQDLNPSTTPGCLGTYTSRTETEYVPITVSKYILALPRDQANAKLKEELDQLQAKAKEQEKALAAAELKVKELGSQVTQALATCKTFAAEQEQKNQLFTTLQTERNHLKEDVKVLRDSDKNVKRLVALEDWAIQVSRVLSATALTGLGLGPAPVTSGKTWAERLLDEDDPKE